MPVTSFFAQASNPSTGTTPRSLLMVRCFLSPGHLGTLAEGDLSSYADAARKVLQLFAPYRHSWRCRHCYDLSYATRQVSVRYRLILKAQKVLERLRGADLGIANPRRYDRLRARHDQALQQSLMLLKI